MRRAQILGLSLLVSSCRVINPGFGEFSGETQGSSLDDLREMSTAIVSTTAASPTAPSPSTESVPESQPSTTSIDEGPIKSDSSIGSSSAASSSSTSSSAQGSTTEGLPSERWDAEGPDANASAGVEDHCLKGSTSCFVMTRAASIASGTPGHEDITLALSNTLDPATSHPSAVSPTSAGVGFDAVTSHAETNGDFPVYEGQDFGIEIWYRSDPNHTFTKNMMLLQVHRNIWLVEFPNGGVACTMPNELVNHEEIQHDFRPVRDTGERDTLRYAVCWVNNHHVYLLSNNKLKKKGPLTGNYPSYRVLKTETTGKLAVGSWSQADANASIGFSRFKGTVYMVRTWNNVTKMKDALLQELVHHGFSTSALVEGFVPDAP